EATEMSLRGALDQAAGYTALNPGPALVTFSGAAATTIALGAEPCVNGQQTALCFTGSRVVVDALDARGEPGAVVLSVGTARLSVLQLLGSDDVFRGLVFQGTQDTTLTDQRDTVAFTRSGALRDRIEQSIIHGPTWGDGVSADNGAGLEGDDANVLDRCE